ncbi:MAG TPA: ABC transporter permease [Streptosporangiaceae bacterium]|nr:ABC transporter permease [Streptosporangiaceae bacterium]
MTTVKLAHDTWLMFQRQMLMMLRNPVWLAFAIAQPIAYLLLFAPLLRSALHVQTQAQAYQTYVPGLLTAIVLIDGLFTGFGLLAELRSGVIERARVTPLARPSLMLGRALRDVVTLLVQAIVITLAALPFGVRVGLGDLALAYLLLAMLGLMSVSLSYALTMKVRHEETLGQVFNTVGQPVLLLSGILLPLALAPLWLRRAADGNPFYWATNSMRALFAGHDGAPPVWQGLAIVAVLAILSVTWSVRLFARAVW